MANKKQESLFNNKDSRASKDIDDVSVFDMNEEKRWEKEWEGMPEYIQKQVMPYREIIVRFKTKSDMQDFFAMIEQNIPAKLKSIWFPKTQAKKKLNEVYVDES